MNKTIGITTVIAVAGAFTLLAATDAHADHSPTTKITKVSVNGGKPVVVGATETTKFKVVITAKDVHGVASVDTQIFTDGAHGSSDGNNDGVCKNTSGTTWVCTETYSLKAGGQLPSNSTAGKWDLWYNVTAQGEGDDVAHIKDSEPVFKLLKRSKLTVNASPEPVAKNSTITVTGKLTRANWATKKYAAYAGQKVKLQFAKAGSSSWTTVKTISSSPTGVLKTTTKAGVDGTYRYVYAGNSTTSSVASAGDYVDVR